MGVNVLLVLSTLLTNWNFIKEKVDHVMPVSTDKEWQAVTIPHDWAIYGSFDVNNDIQFVAVTQNYETVPTRKTGRTGGLPHVGIAWYKTQLNNITISPNNNYFVYFDGAMSEPEVYINGEKVGEWKYGYNAFQIDITQALLNHKNEPVTLAVRLDNKHESSRWYPGAGLFRTVRLIQHPKTFIDTWGVHITTPYVTKKTAAVNIKTSVTNAINTNITLKTYISENMNAPYIDSVISSFNVKHQLPLEQNINIAHPHLWSPETPHLYYATTILICNGEEMETVITKFGIRTVQVVPNIGFLLNGEKRKFQGVCLHHDFGPLGAAVHKDALYRQLTLLKDMGCDAIRTTHNMPATDLIDACDELGFMVLCEPFDEWDMPKCKNGYNRWFNQKAVVQNKEQSITWAEADMINMIHHFRNSPSIVMWSIGNEIPTQCEKNGYRVAQFLQNICMREDGTRPVTDGIDNLSCTLENGFASVLQVVGLNYRTHRYKEAYKKTPQKLILGTETASCVSSRGEYKLPLRINNYQHIIDHSSTNLTPKDMQCSDYGTECCYWSNIPDLDFANMDDYPWTIGQFAWTGFDYLGEPSPYDTDAWPAHSSYFGIIDLAGIQKNNFYLYRSQWNKKQHTIHLLPHWNWNKGDTIPVMAYTDDDQAELFLNGVSMGIRKKLSKQEMETAKKNGDSLATIRRYRLVWDSIPWQPGELRVVTKNGSASQYTASQPHHIELLQEPDYASTPVLHFVRVRIVDKKGNLCPNANNLISFSSNGEGGFLCAANGDPTSTTPFYTTQHNAFHGELTVIIKGKCTLSAKSKNLIGKTINIQ